MKRFERGAADRADGADMLYYAPVETVDKEQM